MLFPCRSQSYGNEFHELGLPFNVCSRSPVATFQILIPVSSISRKHNASKNVCKLFQGPDQNSAENITLGTAPIWSFNVRTEVLIDTSQILIVGSLDPEPSVLPSAEIAIQPIRPPTCPSRTHSKAPVAAYRVPDSFDTDASVLPSAENATSPTEFASSSVSSKAPVAGPQILTM
ncbi:uncharacterized protein DFL_005755 [Arthrobotrys flagrans]|uniref:Uncharacterized protein n=1 Tax=Arthrobotrys flagrans TaxID=97331 RepID=A0A436ZYA4_ARTFL|nr:hypothetical protein DFL_005755 [Arthrobotrys flagrans]